jgi:uncharacterized Ntn-hydrolase superfamily protein
MLFAGVGAILQDGDIGGDGWAIAGNIMELNVR